MKFRHEMKHSINLMDAMLVSKRLQVIAERDAYARDDGSYYVKSLYFDNYNDKVLREKQDGVDKREKFRIRLYNDDSSFIRLEKKSKVHGLCNKQSTPITEEECRKIIENDIEFLLHSDKPLFKELYAKMKYQLLRPKCIVAYDRESFVYPAGNVRVTIDKNVRGSNNIKRFLSGDESMTKLYTNSILEVKWDEFLPDAISRAVNLGKRKATAFSKYAAVRF